MPQFSYYKLQRTSSILLPAYGRPKGWAGTNEELDECIEVEVGTITTKGCAVNTSFGSDCNIDLLTTFHSETRSDNDTTDNAKDDERQDNDDNHAMTVAVLSAPCREGYEREEAILMADVIQRVQGRIKSNGGDDVCPLSPTHRQLADALKEENPKIEGILDERVVAGGANKESADEIVSEDSSKQQSKDEIENADASKSFASDQLASMMRDRVKAIDSVRGLLAIVDPTSIRGLLKTVDPLAATKRTCENYQGKSIEHADYSLCRTSYSSLIF
jgi:hypothetical protein